MPTQATETDFWWPHPSAFDDLTVDTEDYEDGGAILRLSAPDGTACAEWLSFYQQTPERQAEFQREFMQALYDQLERVNNGESKVITDEQSPDHPGDQEDRPGTVEEH